MLINCEKKCKQKKGDGGGKEKVYEGVNKEWGSSRFIVDVVGKYYKAY